MAISRKFQKFGARCDNRVERQVEASLPSFGSFSSLFCRFLVEPGLCLFADSFLAGLWLDRRPFTVVGIAYLLGDWLPHFQGSMMGRW